MTGMRGAWAAVVGGCIILALARCGASAPIGGDDEDAGGQDAEGVADGDGATDSGGGSDVDALRDEGGTGTDATAEYWGPLPAGCEAVFPAYSVRCSVQICPEEWALCCNTHLCGDMSTVVPGCCNDETCGTGGEPMTYWCVEAGRAWSVVTDCTEYAGTPCPTDRPYCCHAWPGPLYLCADHDLGHGWNCAR